MPASGDGLPLCPLLGVPTCGLAGSRLRPPVTPQPWPQPRPPSPASAGRTRIRLKTTGELFSLVPPTSKANNVILGAPPPLPACCPRRRAWLPPRTRAASLCMPPASLRSLTALSNTGSRAQRPFREHVLHWLPTSSTHPPAPPYHPPTSPHLTLSAPRFAGKTWIDTYGDYTLLNSTTGAKAYMYFKPCGWFGAGRYEVGAAVRAASLAKGPTGNSTTARQIAGSQPRPRIVGAPRCRTARRCGPQPRRVGCAWRRLGPRGI